MTQGITKAVFYAECGLANPKFFRKMCRGAWTYWRET